jgi:hypothetical protein
LGVGVAAEREGVPGGWSRERGRVAVAPKAAVLVTLSSRGKREPRCIRAVHGKGEMRRESFLVGVGEGQERGSRVCSFVLAASEWRHAILAAREVQAPATISLFLA